MKIKKINEYNTSVSSKIDAVYPDVWIAIIMNEHSYSGFDLVI